MPPRAARLAAFSLSIGGYLVTVVILWWGFASGKFAIPGGDALIWDRVGDDLRAGQPIYNVAPILSDTFWYAPPWAVLFAAVSWLPVSLMALGIIAAEVASLRFIAGSWLRVGYLCWLPVIAFELPSSQLNLVMAASIAAAIRGHPRSAVVMAAAKLSPLLSIDPHQWRRAIPVAAFLGLITLPWLGLWPTWVAHLWGSYGADLAPGATISVPLVPRLAVALTLFATGRPWARGLAAIIATPSLYWVSTILLLGMIPAQSIRETRGAARDSPGRMPRHGVAPHGSEP